MSYEVIGQLIEQVDDAFFAIDVRGIVTYWNSGAKNMLGYSAQEVLNKSLPFDREILKQELEVAIKAFTQQKQVCLKVTKEHKNGLPVDLFMSIYPIMQQNKLSGFFFSATKQSKYKTAQMMGKVPKTEQKRTFEELRKIIVLALTHGRMTINQVSLKTGVNWKTVEKHLTFFIGKGYVEEVFSSEYVRIFELTQKGHTLVEKVRQDMIAKVVTKDQEQESTSQEREA